jgi:hypothetical protein
MAIEVDTKDCTQLGDSELDEMAELCADGPSGYGIGLLSKQVDAWVLVTTARNNGKGMQGFGFCTLERIGGTPSVLIGLASVKRNTKRDATQRAIVTDILRRAVLAFPDEDVLIGTRITNAGGFELLKNLDDLVPRPDHRPSGEDRAWGKRLAKRFGVEAEAYDERSFMITGSGEYPEAFDHASLRPDAVDADVAALADKLDADRGDSLVVFAWALAEFLDKLA